MESDQSVKEKKITGKQWREHQQTSNPKQEHVLHNQPSCITREQTETMHEVSETEPSEVLPGTKEGYGHS